MGMNCRAYWFSHTDLTAQTPSHLCVEAHHPVDHQGQHMVLNQLVPSITPWSR